MNMKRFFYPLVFAAALACACAGGPAASSSPAPASAAPVSAAALAEDESLDGAIAEAASYFSGELPSGARVAITGVDAPAGILSDYIAQELWQGMRRSGKFVMIDRRNQGALLGELLYQQAGFVADDEENPAQRLGKALGAEYIIHGEALPFGEAYRLALYASQPERGTSLPYAKNVRPEARFLPEKTLDAAVERAVAELGRNLTARTRVGLGKISYGRYETASDFSVYLRESIINKAARHDKYEISGEEGREYSALLEGSFYPGGGGVVVMLRLAAFPGGAFIGAAKFTIDQAELDRNGAPLLPSNTTQADLERVRRAIAPYDGKNNAFGFTVQCLRPDTVFYDGDALAFQLYAERDCYFRVTMVDARGKQTVMYPVKRRDNNFIRAGQRRILPGNEGFVIRLHEPYGVEYILVAAFEEQFAREPEREVDVSEQSIRAGLKARGGTREDSARDSVLTDTSLEAVATARFNYTIRSR